MKLAHQGSLFLLFGGIQLALDWLLYVVLTAFGVPVITANILARTVVAALGFVLNGRYTFARAGTARLGWCRFSRFGMAWLTLTALSTLLLTLVANRFGLGHSWLAKPLVEAFMAAISFCLQRHWVYR